MPTDVTDELAAKFVRYLETGEAPDRLFAPDLFLDFTMPTWRSGRLAEGALALRKAGHPSPGTGAALPARPHRDRLRARGRGDAGSRRREVVLPRADPRRRHATA